MRVPTTIPAPMVDAENIEASNRLIVCAEAPTRCRISRFEAKRPPIKPPKVPLPSLLIDLRKSRLSVKARRIDVAVPESEIGKRRAQWRPPVAPPLRGYAKLYMDHVLQAEHGCDFYFLRKA